MDNCKVIGNRRLYSYVSMPVALGASNDVSYRMLHQLYSIIK